MIRQKTVLAACGIMFFYFANVLHASEDCTAAAYSSITPKEVSAQMIRDAASGSGTSIVRVTIAKDGSVKELTLQSSSGSNSLDQAALSLVKEYHFRPKVCRGVGVSSSVLVPVVFNAPERRPENVKFAVDESPLEFGSISEEVAYLKLRRETDVRSNDEGDVYFGINQPLVWIVRKEPGGKDGFVVRIKGERQGNNIYQLYSTQCEFSAGWCAAELDWSLDMVRGSPLLPAN